MKVSVFLTTYNHERFIEQAVRSVLMQQVDFDYEVLVGEDASTDGTARVVERLQDEYPNRVRALLRTRNLGMHRNFIEVYHACRGEYIAYLDGDDYWTSPDKLQKQVDYLEEHQGCSICFHNAGILSDDPNELQNEYFVNRSDRTVFTIVDLILQNNIIPSCSIVARNGLIDHFPEWLPEITTVDWVFNILNARRGKIGYIPETLAVYRRHSGGVWSAVQEERRRQEVLKVYKYLPSVLDPELGPVVEAAADRLTLWYGNEWLRQEGDRYRAELERSFQAYEAGQAWIREMEKAKDWFVGQIGSYQALLAEQTHTHETRLAEQTRTHETRLAEQARAFQSQLAEQARAHQVQLAEQARSHQARMEQQERLHRAREAEQARDYEARLESMARVRDAARAMSDALVSRLHMIERPRPRRFASMVQRLRGLLG